jgi:flavorubredoxin
MFRKIKDDIYSVGVIDWHRKLFDELISLPDGTSYNSYFIQGQEKNAIIDTVEPDFDQDFLDNLEQAGVEKVDYIISNHAEQDHSGTIPVLLEKYPEAEVLCSAKAKSMLLDLLELKEEQIRVVEDGETLELGGKTLEFIDTPWVHWPETMSTYLQEENILFPCDRMKVCSQTSRACPEEGQLAISLVDASTVVFGSPTVLTGPHPAAVYAAYVANILKPKTRYASIIGSYGWAGRMTDKLLDLMPNLKVELYDPVVAKGHGSDEDYQEIDRLVDEIKIDLENL